jgi:hypothetical protein
LGGHQWAHSSSRDLIHWEHHPLLLAVEDDWEGSICTGSVYFHDRVYHAFFATRKRDWTQHSGHAVSDDGVHFRKLQPNPFASASPGYGVCDLRDPFVFRDDAGNYHMLVSARIDPYPSAQKSRRLHPALHVDRPARLDRRRAETVGAPLHPASTALTAGVSRDDQSITLAAPQGLNSRPRSSKPQFTGNVAFTGVFDRLGIRESRAPI